MFENFRVFETEFAGRKMTFETGKMCCQAGGSVLVRYGETTVLVNATASAKPRDGIDFLPLKSISGVRTCSQCRTCRFPSILKRSCMP